MRRKRKCTILVYRVYVYIFTLRSWPWSLQFISTVLLIARFAWCTVAVSSLLVNFLRGIFGTVFPFHFRNFSENSSFSVIHPYSYSRFSVQRTRTRKKLILNNRWNKRFERFHTRFFFFFRIFGDYGGFRILMDLLKRGWSFVRIVDYVLFMFVIQIRKERVINRFSIQMNPILSYNSQKWDRVSPRFKLLIRRIFEIVVATFIEIIGRIVGLQ